MANNRMYLKHRPSGKMVYLGKRMLAGYYAVSPDLAENMETLFDEAEKGYVPYDLKHLDDFCVCFEDNTYNETAEETKWLYGGPDVIRKKPPESEK